jgi:ketosteroid isomerase-like protein
VSDDYIALVRRNYDFINAIGRTDAEFVDPEEAAPDMWARVAPEVELHERSDLPDAKVYRGRDETKEFWRKTQELFAEVHWQPREFIDLGDVIVVDTTLVGVGRGSDVPIEATEADVFWFRDGMLVRIAAFPTKKEAVDAARRWPS